MNYTEEFVKRGKFSENDIFIKDCLLYETTKEAVAIAVIPKVIDYAKNNKEMVKIPDNVMKMANTFMEKKIQDWSESLGSKDSSAVPIDSQIKTVTAKVEELKKIKESAEKALK